MKCTSCGGVNNWRRGKCAYCHAPTNRNITVATVVASAVTLLLGALLFLSKAGA